MFTLENLFTTGATVLKQERGRFKSTFPLHCLLKCYCLLNDDSRALICVDLVKLECEFKLVKQLDELFIKLENINLFISPTPMSTAVVEGRRPLMLKGPADSYIVRNHPASLSCRFMYAERISFKCNDEWVFDSNHENKQGLDEKTGAVFLETRILVHKREVEQYFGSDGFTCECYAYSSSRAGQDQEPSSSGTEANHNKNLWTKSEPATIRIAHLKKHFDREPVADRQPLGGAVHIPCLPPEGEPRPEVFWLKNDREIESKGDPNVIIAHDGALIIAVARLSDSGNYTCGARNLAGQRQSHAVPVTIYVDGGWSEWSHWTGSCPSTCSEYDHYTNVRKPLRRQRYRQCIRPAPINGGRTCQGQSEQAKDCDIVCSVDGQWTEWSTWSLCERLTPLRHQQQPGSYADETQSRNFGSCQRFRKRRCDAVAAVAESSSEFGYGPATKTPVSCHGREALELRNCTDEALCHFPGYTLPGDRKLFASGRPYPPSSIAPSGGDSLTINLATAAGLGAAVLVFVVALLFLFGFLLRRLKTSRSHTHICRSPYSSTTTSSSSASCRRCSSGNKDYECDGAPHHATKDRGHGLRSGKAVNREHEGQIYAPLSLSDETTGRGSGAGNASTLFKSGRKQPPSLVYDAPPSLKSDRSRLALLAWPGNTNIEPSEHSGSGDSADHHYATVEDPVPLASAEYEKRASLTSALIPASYPRVWGRVGSSGGRLDLSDFGVSLYIPEGAIGQSPYDTAAAADFLLAICPGRPKLPERRTLLTPTVLVWAFEAGDQQMLPLVLRKPIILTLEHCAQISGPHDDDWTFQIYASDLSSSEKLNDDDWELAVTVGKETLNSAIFCQMDQGHCHIMTENLGRLALAGDPTPAACQILRLLTFVSDVSLRVYCVPDDKTCLRRAMKQEDDLGGRLAADPERRLAVQRSDGSKLRLRLDDMRPEWRLKPGANVQEIPDVHLWKDLDADDYALHCSFALESPSAVNRHPTDYLSGRLTISQVTADGYQWERLVMDVDTSVDWPWSEPEPTKSTAHLLPTTVKGLLTALLNPPLDAGNDWRMLAACLSVDHYLPYFASRPSPTELILSLWEARSKDASSIQWLAQIFHNMQRPDAVQLLLDLNSEQR